MQTEVTVDPDGTQVWCEGRKVRFGLSALKSSALVLGSHVTDCEWETCFQGPHHLHSAKQNVSGDFLAAAPPSEHLCTPCHRCLVIKLQRVILKWKVQVKQHFPDFTGMRTWFRWRCWVGRSEADPRSWISDKEMLMQLDKGREFG